MLYASSGQTSVMVPYDVAGKVTTGIVVEYQGVQSLAAVYSVSVAVPGIYALNSQGSGPGAILNPPYTIASVNLPSRPVQKGVVVAVYMTGGGLHRGGRQRSHRHQFAASRTAGLRHGRRHSGNRILRRDLPWHDYRRHPGERADSAGCAIRAGGADGPHVGTGATAVSTQTGLTVAVQ